MKEIKVAYKLEEIDDKFNVSRKVQGATDSDAEEIFSFILADIINTFKESGASKSLTKETMNEVIDTVYQMHPTHPEE